MVANDVIQGRRTLPPYARAVFEQIRADCKSLGATAGDTVVTPTWEDLYQIELASLAARDETDLRRSAWFIRLRFRNVAGERAYLHYVASSPPDPATAERRLLYADLLNVVRRTYYLMMLIPASDHVRRMLIIGSSFMGAIAIFVVTSIVIYPNNNAVFLVCLMCGGIGGVTSLIQRVKQLPDGDPLLFRLSGGATLVQSLCIPPVTGAIFAGVLTLLFTAHAVTGDLFPRINTTTANTFIGFIATTRPADGSSMALLLVWSFIAEFAERLVPDTIDRFVAKSDPPR